MRQLAFAAALLCSTPALAQDFTASGVTVVTNGQRLAGQDVSFSGGNLSLQAGSGDTLSGEDLYITPGLFLPFAQIGLVDIGQETATNDTHAFEAETSVSNRAADAYNPKAVAIGNSRRDGIIHSAVVPNGAPGIFGGTGSLVDLSGSADSILIEDAFVFANLGERGASAAGGSRSAALSQLRGALDDAERRFATASDGDALSRQDARALQAALDGEIPLALRANRASDLLRVAGLLNDYPDLDIVVIGASEAWKIADRLTELKLVIDPLDNLPSSFESVGARGDQANILAEAGVDFAFAPLTGDLTHYPTTLPHHAGNAVGEGLDWDAAFAAISTVPAAWFGVNAEIVGGDDFVVWEGDPLEVTSAPIAVYIDGVAQPMRSRQQALAARYLPGTDRTDAFKYR